MLADWLAALPGAPVNRVRADAVDWPSVVRGRPHEVDVVLDWDAGRGIYVGTATAWTTEHVQVNVSVPGRGVLLLWVPAGDVRRRDPGPSVEPSGRRRLPAPRRG